MNIYKTIPAVMDGYRKLGVEVRRFPLFIRATEIERHNRAVQRMRDDMVGQCDYLAKVQWCPQTAKDGSSTTVRLLNPTEARTATEKP